ncbi:M17 family metallopeptidase [Nocardioides sp.]|uniref:leucyl aminopeptidase family protein n=1 Tax=Nocardioides sp. TaxID=35761 RepID=UPI003518157E
MTLRATLPSQVSPPEIALSASGPHALAGCDVVALPVLPAEPRPQDEPGGEAGAPLLGPGADAVAEALGMDLVALADALRVTGTVGEIATVPVPLGGPDQPDLRAVLLVGVGAHTPDDRRRAAAVVARATRDRACVATTLAALDAEHGVEAVTTGLMLGSFDFAWRSAPPEHVPVRRAVLAGLPDAVDGRAGQPLRDRLARAVAVAGASWQARTLATVPSNLKNPAWLAEQAQAVGEAAGLTVEVWDEHRLAEVGFGGVLGVGQASATPPRLIRLDYRPRKAGRKTPTVVLVGKGITFDTGGLSIKPAQGMTTMKRDMTGGAVVISVLAALAAVDCPFKVVGLVPAAENAISGRAMRPGDVIRHYGGRTSEVTNTDAEGRLVMADALAWAAEQLDPVVMVDVATLTGAVKVALGQQVGGLFATHDALADRLLEAGTRSGEPLWRLPLYAGYEDRLASKVADADNAAGGPGAITAALFLQHFTGGLPWAHLDIASVGDSPTDAYEYVEGPTGFGARLLLDWLADPTALDGLAG